MRRYVKGKQHWAIAFDRIAFTIEIDDGKLGKTRKYKTLERVAAQIKAAGPREDGGGRQAARALRLGRGQASPCVRR